MKTEGTEGTEGTEDREERSRWMAFVLALIVTAGGVAVRPQAVGLQPVSPRSAGQLNVCHAGSVQLAFAQVEAEFTAPAEAMGSPRSPVIAWRVINN